MKNLVLLLLAITMLSCGSSEKDSSTCIDDMLQMLDMEDYNGQIEADCRDYLNWSTYEGNDYFMRDNACADIMLHLWDCQKVDICEENWDECQTIFTNMTQQGIVGRSVQ